MSQDASDNMQQTTRVVLDRPTFSPPPDMRGEYLERRKSEIDGMFDNARNGEWKPVLAIANHVRGSGAMYGFPNLGSAAEALSRAIQNGDEKSIDHLAEYAGVVKESYI